MSLLKLITLLTLMNVSPLFAGSQITLGETTKGLLSPLCGSPSRDAQQYQTDLDRSYFSCKSEEVTFSVDNQHPLENDVRLLHGTGYPIDQEDDPYPAEIKFSVPKIIASCSYRCPHYLSISVEILLKHTSGREQTITPMELTQPTIKADKDCSERYRYSARTDVKVNKPPCYYKFMNNHQTLSTRVIKNADQYTYSLLIRNKRKLHLKPGPKRFISFHVQGPIQFQWTSVESD